MENCTNCTELFEDPDLAGPAFGGYIIISFFLNLFAFVLITTATVILLRGQLGGKGSESFPNQLAPGRAHSGNLQHCDQSSWSSPELLISLSSWLTSV